MVKEHSIKQYIPRLVANQMRKTGEWVREKTYPWRKALALYLYAHLPPRVSGHIQPMTKLETYADLQAHKELLTDEQRAEQQKEFTE